MDITSIRNLSDDYISTSTTSNFETIEELQLLKCERKTQKSGRKISDILSPETVEELRIKNTESFQCLAQITLSRSSVLRHCLYNFPPVSEAGVNESLDYIKYEVAYDSAYLQSTDIYTSKCHDLKTGIIQRVLKSLTKSKLDLRYFGLNAKQLKSITAALTLNRCVKELNLGENYLTSEDVFHISEMMRDNNCIEYLNLSSCNIVAVSCAELVEGLSTTQSVRELDLSKNNMGSVGLAKILRGIRDNFSIVKLDLSHNLLNEEVAEALGGALSENETIEELNLSWNNFNTRKAIFLICRGLSAADVVKILNLSWNSIKDEDIFYPIQRYLFKTKTLQHLDLSNNQMQGNVLQMVKKSILGNSSLISINMSSNLISPEEAYNVAQVFVAKTRIPLKLQYLDLENVVVNKNFVPFWQMVTSRGKHIRIEHVLGDYEIAGPNVIKILFDRLRYITNKRKNQKSKRNFGHILYNFGADSINKSDFLTAIKTSRVPNLKNQHDLLKEIMKMYTIKYDKLDIKRMKEDYYNLYPSTTISPAKKSKAKRKIVKLKHADAKEGSAYRSNLQSTPSMKKLIIVSKNKTENALVN